MAKQISTVITGATLTFALLVAAEGTVHAGPGGGFAGGRGGYGCYGRGCYGYGRGWGYGYGGWGWGVGLGLYYPYYGFYEPYYAYGAYPVPAYGAAVNSAYSAAPPAGEASTMAAQKPPEGARPVDDAAHLQLILPENAEVWINGVKSPQTAKVQEVVTPALARGANYSYAIEVRVKDPSGKEVVDRRTIHFHSNDWFSIDLTRPAPTAPTGVLGPAPELIDESKLRQSVP